MILLSGCSDTESTELTGDVMILAPKDGATVSGPVILNVESPTFHIANPADGIEGAAHFHAFVDIRPFTASGAVIPQGEGIYHFYSNSVRLDLPPGQHRIIVLLGDNDEVRIPGATVAGLTVTVE